MTITKGTPMTTTIPQGIPGIREQVRAWTGGRAAKDAEAPQRETLDVRSLKILGVVGRSSWATHGGRELRLRGPAAPHAIEQAPADAILVRQPVRSADGRQRIDTYLASVQEPGSFARMAARKRYRPKERQPSPIDRDHELRAESPRQFIELGRDAGTPQDIIRGAMSRGPSALITDGRPALRSVADEVAMLERKGASFAVSDDGMHLLVTTKGGGVASAMIDARAALYLGHLKREPVRCAWPHPKGKASEAVTYAVGGSPVCADHLAGVA